MVKSALDFRVNNTGFKNVTESCFCCSEDKRGHNERDEEASSLVDTRGTGVSKNFNEIIRLQVLEKRKVEMRGEK